MSDYFPLSDLITVLQEVEHRAPSARVGRSRKGTGNLCIYVDDEYTGVIELHDPPEFTLFTSKGDDHQ